MRIFPRESLLPIFQPRLVNVSLSKVVTDVEACEQELSERASPCWGYFPLGKGQIEHDLPASQALAAALPTISVGGKDFEFSWLRYSAGFRSMSQYEYHLDSDGKTGIEGIEADDSLIPHKRVWRLLVNLHSEADRNFSYVDAAPEQFNWEQDGGNIGLAPEQSIDSVQKKELIIPRRVGSRAAAGLVCVSRVPHAGKETNAGHFLGSWSLEQN